MINIIISISNIINIIFWINININISNITILISITIYCSLFLLHFYTVCIFFIICNFILSLINFFNIEYTINYFYYNIML